MADMLKRPLTTAIALLTAACLTGCVQAATTANSLDGIFEAAEVNEEGVVEAAPTPEPALPEGSLFDLDITPEQLVAAAEEGTVAAFAPVQGGFDGLSADIGALPELMPEPEGAPEPTPTPAPEDTTAPDGTPEPEEEGEDGYRVEEIEDTEGYVYADTVNLREGPGTGYDIIREYGQYRELTVTGECGDWYRVEVGSSEGFMLSEFVKLGDPPEATPEPTPTPRPTPAPTLAPTPTPAPTDTPRPADTPQPTQAPQMDAGSSSYTGDELYLLAQIVYKEGDGESYTAVASVLQNRINSSKFPSSVSGVVYQSGQFSTSNLKTPSSAAQNAVTSVFVNGNNVLPSDVLYFRTASSWDGHQLYGKIGGNYFYY